MRCQTQEATASQFWPASLGRTSSPSFWPHSVWRRYEFSRRGGRKGEGERAGASQHRADVAAVSDSACTGTVIQERRFLEEKPAQHQNCMPGSGTEDEGGMTLQLPPWLERNGGAPNRHTRRGQHTSTTEQLYSEFTFSAVRGDSGH